MTNPRGDSPHPSSYDFYPHLFSASLATFLAYPIRTCTNIATFQNCPAGLRAEFVKQIGAGFGLNMLRGSLALGLQSYALEKMENQNTAYYHPSLKWILPTLIGTSVGFTLETPFIRKNLVSKGSQISLLRFNLPLFLCLLTRDASFATVVLGKNHWTSFEYPFVFTIGTVISAISHKFYVWEASADVKELHQKGTTPQFSNGQGFLKPIRNMALGKVYTHEVCKPFYPNPDAFLKKSFNFLFVACGPMMLSCRVLQFLILSYAKDFGLQTSRAKNGFFSESTKIPTKQEVEHPFKLSKD